MGKQLHPALAGRCRPGRLGLRCPCRSGGEESPADVVGDVAVQRLVGPIEPQLPDRRREDEVHLQSLLHAGTPALEIDRPGVLEHLLPFLRGGWIARDVAAAVEVRQFAVADNLQRLERHHTVAAAERVGGLIHELPPRRSTLAGQADRGRGGDRRHQ
jgi:hypothetical protein